MFVLPSGTFLGVPIKTALSALLMVLLIFYRRDLIFDFETKIFIFCSGMLAIWSIIAFANGFLSSSFSFIKNFISLLLIIWISMKATRFQIISYNSIVKTLGITSICIIFFKIILSLALSLNFISLERLTSLISTLFRVELTTMFMPLGSFTFYRVMLSNDQIPIVWYSFYAFSRSKNWKKILLTILMIVYVFIIYSRVAMIEFVAILLTLLIVLALERRQKGKKDLKKIVFIGTIIIVTFVTVNNKIDFLSTLASRFSSASTTDSDSIRNIQFSFLWEGFNSRPLFGYGTGSYVREYIRSESMPFSYELEYLSFLYQFGIIGFILIFLPLIFSFWSYSFKNIENKNIKILLFVSLILWLIRPFFNPSFLSSNSGILIVIMHSYSILLNYQKQDCRQFSATKKPTFCSQSF